MSAIATAGKAKRLPKHKDSIWLRFWKTRFLFILWVPALIKYIMFNYVPMWGISVAFFDYDLWGGWETSKFVGLQNFEIFFKSPDFWKITRNTLMLGLQNIFISFPIIVLFALMLNEVRNLRFKKIVQTVSYMPHFMSTVVVCGLVTSLLDPVTGGINAVIKLFGGTPIYFMIKSEWFRPIYLISGLWQGLGWGTIVFLAAISGVDPTLYEAARLDGAGRWRQMWNITLPAIAPTTATMFILRVGNIMDGALEKTLLLQQPITYETSQVIVTYIYYKGLGSAPDYGFATAVEVYSNLINLTLLLLSNWVCKKVTDTGIF